MKLSLQKDFNMAKEKIVILGGGVSAMTAAVYLTDDENWQDKYDITVYQQGWRIGGKGASGRNPYLGQRIEEHGLHVWFGAYVNSFKTIQSVYEKLARPDSMPLATWQEAFKPHSYVVLQELIDNEWQTWPVDFPLIPGNPADGTLDLHFWDIARLLYFWIKKFIGELEHKANSLNKVRDIKTPENDEEQNLFAHFIDEVKEKVDDIKDEWQEFKDDAEDSLETFSKHIQVTLSELSYFFDKRASDKNLSNTKHPSAIQWIIRRFKRWLNEEFEDLLEDNADIRRLYICADLALAMMEGLIEDKVFKRGFGAINNLDFRAWLEKHGANTQFSVDSAPVRGFYDLVFAYQDGDFAKPNVEAGVAALAMLRLSLCYHGGVMWKMQAGMGDTIFSPIYELLIKRGVKFEYFNQVTQLLPTQSIEGESSVDEIKLIKQVALKTGQYHPLVDVKGLPCWPSFPLYEQIDDEQAALIKQHNINLESFYSDWPSVYQQHFGEALPEVTLKQGVDFDKVIYGISVASLPHLCEKLLAKDHGLSLTSQKVKAVATQAFQLWLDKPLDETGWAYTPASGEQPILSGFSEPFDTWASMDQLINKEDWQGDVEPKNVAYFCSAFTQDSFPPSTQSDFQAMCNARVKANSVFKLTQQMYPLWPDIAKQGEFDWQALMDTTNAVGEARFDSQYWRANVDPSERYVMSVVDSSQYRLATDGTQFANLLITGDWIKTGVNAGCVEAATMAGMATSRAICGYPNHISGEFGFEPDEQ